eukprot:2137300-Rhodomonas_salina.1
MLFQAERRWKQYFESDAMAALDVLNKATFSIPRCFFLKPRPERGFLNPPLAQTFSNPLVLTSQHPNTKVFYWGSEATPAAIPGGGLKESGEEKEEKGSGGEGGGADAEKPKPLSDEAFQVRAQCVGYVWLMRVLCVGY